MRRDLVLLHGWGMNSKVWTPLLPFLQSEYCVHLLDLPGHGECLSKVDDNLPAWAQAVAAQAPDQALWVAWSLGGLLALEIAASMPNKMAALVVTAGTAKFVQDSDWFCAMQSSVFDQFDASLDLDVDVTMRRFFALVSAGCEDPRAILKQLKAWYAEQPPQQHALRTGLALLRSADMRESLQKIRLPLMFLLAGEDKLIPQSLHNTLRQRYPAVECTLAEHSGHALFLDKPEWFVRTLNEFFKRRLSSS